MNWYISIFSGIIQGLTEFLPISSSGHLMMTRHFLKMPANQLEFDIFLHLGTLGSIICVFYKDILKIVRFEFKLIVLLITATIPSAVFVLLFDEKIESAFGHLKFTGFMLLITAMVLFSAGMIEKIRIKKREEINFMDAVLIGISQALAIFPGLSRSGLTISAGLSRGLSREQAIKFSFFMAILAISGAYIFKLTGINIQTAEISFLNIFLGTLTSFLTGILAIKLVFRVLRAQKWHFFAFYCAAMGTLVLIIT